MNSKPKKLLYLLTTLPFLSLFAQGQEEQKIFSERFTNLTGAGVNLTEYGFTALIYDPRHGDPTKPIDVTIRDDQPFATDTAVGQGGVELSFDENDEGVIYMWTGGKETWYLFLTELAAVDRSQMELTRVKWYHRRSGDALGDFQVRVAVKIDGQVYASSTDMGETGTDVQEWKSKEFVFTTAAEDWHVLTADPSLDWNLDTTPLDGPLPSGDIEAVGFYVHRGLGQGSIWLDEVEVFAAPVGGTTWAGYPVDAEGNVDTMDWLQMLHVSNSPWIYSYSLNQWMYIDEASVGESGSWIYAVKF